MSDWEKERDERNAAIDAGLAALGLTVESVFIPYSQSRNAPGKDKKNPDAWPSLNWRVTVKRNGRNVLATDYSAGAGHCPGNDVKTVPTAYRAPRRRNYMGKDYPGTTSQYRIATEAERLADYRNARCAAECESGFAMELDWQAENRFKSKKPVQPILPDARDVFHSLVMDFSVLDSGGFENWVGDYGYDTDSRTAESTYRLCLDLALKMRAGIGEAGLETLRDLFTDY